MPLVKELLEKTIADALLPELKKVTKKPKDAKSDYDDAIKKQAEAIAKGISGPIIDAVKQAIIVAPSGGGTCTIS